VVVTADVAAGSDIQCLRDDLADIDRSLFGRQQLYPH
jgi:hypothetical protein